MGPNADPPADLYIHGDDDSIGRPENQEEAEDDEDHPRGLDRLTPDLPGAPLVCLVDLVQVELGAVGGGYHMVVVMNRGRGFQKIKFKIRYNVLSNILFFVSLFNYFICVH